MEIRFDRIWYLNNFQSRFWVVEIKSIGIFGMLEPMTFAQASHCNHFDQINGGKINDWWKQRHRKYSQIYLDSTSIFYTFCVTFTFIFYFFESLIQFTGWGEVRCGCSQIPSLGTNSITWNKIHHLKQIPSLGTNSITWSKFRHLGQTPSLGTNSIIWEKFHNLGQIPSLGTAASSRNRDHGFPCKGMEIWPRRSEFHARNAWKSEQVHGIPTDKEKQQFLNFHILPRNQF